eukprot:7711911-Heterocapsa_arctica.AAC.1
MQEHAGLPDLQSIIRHAREPEVPDEQRQDEWNDRLDQEHEREQGMGGGRHREEAAHDMLPPEHGPDEDRAEL